MHALDRRQLLRRIGLAVAAIPLVNLATACGDDGAPAGPDATIDPDGPDVQDAPPSDWASGGTGAMTDKATYPDPFATPAVTCIVVGATTEGPCNTPNTDLDREDISEGLPGLPVRLAIKITDGSCTPLAGATVKIWHTDVRGVYSGMTPNPAFCSENNPEYTSKNFSRGVRTSDANGVVYFDTVYPGWYPGRAIHIHFQVRDAGGTNYKISQLFFPESLTQSIFASHVDYTAFGQPNTPNSRDGVWNNVPAADRDRLMLDIARMTDGAMLASKVVAVTA